MEFNRADDAPRPDRLGSRHRCSEQDVRRVQLAWGAAITAEWAHFVALGVFAYEQGGTSAVGVAGLVRLLPAALLAPFAASLGDRFRRERFLLAMMLVGSGGLAASAAAAFAGERVLVFGFAALIGISSTLVRPALQALLPSLARTPEELIASNAASSTVESLGTLAGPLLAGVLVALTSVGVVFIVGAAMLLGAAAVLARVRVEGRNALAGVVETETVRRNDRGRRSRHCECTQTSAAGRTRCRAGLRSRLPERPDRGRRLPRPRRRRQPRWAT